MFKECSVLQKKDNFAKALKGKLKRTIPDFLSNLYTGA